MSDPSPMFALPFRVTPMVVRETSGNDWAGYIVALWQQGLSGPSTISADGPKQAFAGQASTGRIGLLQS